MAVVNGIFEYGGLPRNSVTVKLWPAGRFASAPAQDTALPSGSPTSSGTTGTANGGAGSYRFTGVPEGGYYVSAEYAGHICYEFVAAGAVSVKDLGAVGDGTTDDTTAFNNAVAALSSGGRIEVPPGTYRIAGTITLTTGVELCGAGMYATTLLADDVSGDVVQASASHNVSAALASTNSVGLFTVTVAAGQGANWSSGATIYLQDSDSDNGTFTTRVRSVAGDVITLQEAAPYAWDSGNGGTAFGYSGASAILTGVAVRDMTIRTTGSGLAASNRGNLIQLTRCEDSLIENVRAVRSTTDCILLLGCRNTTVRGCHVENAGTASNGIALQTCTACEVSSSTTHRCPFGIVATRSPYLQFSRNRVHGKHDSSEGRGIKIEAGCAHCVIEANTISSFALFGVYVSDSWQNTVCGNVIFSTGGGGGAPDNQHGIQIGGDATNLCRYNVVANNTIHGASGYGVAINPTGGHGQDTFNLVSGNVISHCNSGIFVGSKRNAVVGNMLHDLADGYISGTGGGVGVLCNGIAASGAGSNTIAANTFGPSLTTAISTDGANSAGSNFIVANNLNGNTNALHATDLPAYTVTNLSTDRAYDADATSDAEIADVLGTLITDLKAAGIVG